jgi:predicted RNA-binding Zn-ribbon protein involved in translation (DUF1610 family)
MNYEIRPWGHAFSLSHICPKCGAPMHEDDDRRSCMTAYVCFKCGNRLYPDYPKRLGSGDATCGEVEGLAA